MFKPDPNDVQYIQCKEFYSPQDLEYIEGLMEHFVSEESLQKGKVIEMAKRIVRLPDGRQAFREIAYHSGAAAVVPVDEEGNVYLVYQHRCVVNKVTLEIPAGKMDEGETDPEACAVRELSEETGLVASNMELLIKMDSSPGFCTEYVAIYLATGLTQLARHTDEGEFLGVVKMPLKEAMQRVQNGELTDAKTALGILMAAWRMNTNEIKQ